MKQGLRVLSAVVSLLVSAGVHAVTVFTVEGDKTKMIISTATCQELRDAGVKVDHCVETPRAGIREGGYDGYGPNAERSREFGTPVLVGIQGGFTAGVRHERERVSDWKLDTTAIDAEYTWGDVVAPYVHGSAGRADVEAGRDFEGDGTVLTAGAGVRFRRDLSPWSVFADYRYRTLRDTGTFRPDRDTETTIDHSAQELSAGVRYAILANRLAAIAGVRRTRANADLDTTFADAYTDFTSVDLDRTELVAGAELRITQPLALRFEIATGDGDTQSAVSLSYRFGRRPPAGLSSLSNATVEGTITAPDGRPLKGVTITTDRTSSQSGRDGRFSISAPRQTRTPITFTHPDFVKTIRVVDTRSPATVIGVVIWPRAPVVTFDAAAGGLVPFAAGGGVRIPPNSLVTAGGRPVTGNVDIRLTLLDVSDRAQLRSVPGDFTARMRDERTRVLESFGVFEIAGTASGEAVDLRPGTRASIEVPVPERIRPWATPRSTTFSFEPASGLWIEQGEAVFEGSTYNGWITTFDSAWNVDNPVDTTCIHARVIRVYPTTGPVAGATVTATGVSYTGISNATTDAQGYACLLVKINSVVDLEAIVGTTSLGTQQVATPNVVAGAAQCTNFALCPVVGVPFEKDW